MKRIVKLSAGVALLLAGFGCTKSNVGGTKTSPQSVSPCSTEGQAKVLAANKLSMPAGDNIFQADPADLAYSLANLSDLKRRPFADPNTHGDQCRAVLGPLPVLDCPTTPFIEVTYQGKVMTIENGKYLADGKPTDWTPEVGCDRPGHIGLLFAKYPGNDVAESCDPTNRLGGKRIGNVYWAWLCHKTHGDHADFLTVIGANVETGETCFIGHDIAEDPDPAKHVVVRNVIPPGGIHPESHAERKAAAEFWEPGHMFVCLDCHSANGPFIGTPNARSKRVGHNVDNSVPLFPRFKDRMTPGYGFRVIGTGQNVFSTNIPLQEPRRPKAIVPMNDDKTPDTSCTKCHQISDQEHYVRLARLAVGLNDTYVTQRKEVPWMPHGIDPTDAEAVKDAQAAVARYERAWKDPKWRYSENELLADCPAPADLVSSTAKTSVDAQGAATLAWQYANDYGAVPLRDDVRFRVQIEGSDGSTCQIRDVAPEAIGSTDWKLTHPTQNGVSYSYKVQPYRYCFDRQPYAYAKEAVIGGK